MQAVWLDDGNRAAFEFVTGRLDRLIDRGRSQLGAAVGAAEEQDARL
jgi:hypothetical protein